MKVHTEYTIICGNNLDDDAQGRKTHPGGTGDAPLVSTIVLPLGPPASCYISAVATKTAPAQMTFSLLQRAAPG